MTTGVLLMAYGSPDRLEDVEPYLRDIRGGKPIRPGLLEEVTERYRRIGLPSPLLEITGRQAAGVQRELGGSFAVTVGMKHWIPSIRSAIEDLLAAGAGRIVGVALAPHYSRISIGGYASRTRAVLDDLSPGMPFRMVPSWYEETAFVDLVAANIRAALAGWSPGEVHVLFTAHSLPERIGTEGDPYRDQLLASEKLVADAAGIPNHSFAFQSASATGEPWLGPDILDVLTEHAGRRVLVCPIGFASDHLEILYDLDVEAAEHAARHGIALRRVRSPNDDPAFARVLAGVVRRAAA